MRILPQGIATVFNAFNPLFTCTNLAAHTGTFNGRYLMPRGAPCQLHFASHGLSQEKRFEKYHRVFNRAKWNSMTWRQKFCWGC